jgi:hypothetical protein
MLERLLRRIDRETAPSARTSWLATFLLWAGFAVGFYFLFKEFGASSVSLVALSVAAFLCGGFAAYGAASAWQSLWWSFVARYIDVSAVRARLRDLQA